MNDLITNGTDIKKRIISEINGARQHIFIATAWFTDRDIAEAIIQASRRNVTVDIVLSSYTPNDTVKEMFRIANISVREVGDEREIMRHKFCLIDNRITLHGPYNYTYKSSNNSEENINISYDAATYNQHLAVFERLKYNIDNNIGANEPEIRPEPYTSEQPTPQPMQPVNIIETFSRQLRDLVYSAVQIDADKYKELGYTTSRESSGSIAIFRAEYNNIKEKIRAYATDEGLGSRRNMLTTNVSIAYDSTKSQLEQEKLDQIEMEKKNNELEKRQISDMMAGLKKEKAVLESGNTDTGEKGLLQINKELEKNNLERKMLEQTLIVRKFWSPGTVSSVGLLAIFTFYLSLFFASAMYKMFFEGNAIQNSLEKGLTPEMPRLVDANAIISIFNQQGPLFGIMATIFFLFPVLLSNLHLLGSKEKLLNRICFWGGLILFDIVVAGVVAFNMDRIKASLNGVKSSISVWEIVKLGEFWEMFMFGMIPLFITHYAIDHISKAYKNSRRDLVDLEKSRRIQSLEEEIIELNAQKESLIFKIKEKEEAISGLQAKTLSLETNMNNRQNQIEQKYAELQRQISAIFNDFCARIKSGRIFTEVVLDSVVLAYKSGFIEFLPEYYASEEVSNRVREIENASTVAF